jgi:hypothetical protein
VSKECREKSQHKYDQYMLCQFGGVEISGNDINKVKLHTQRNYAHITFGKQQL